MLKRTLLLVVALAATALVAASSGLANTSNDSASGWNVTETLTLYYNASTCNGGTAYQIYEVSAKWVRPDLNKEIETDNYNAGETGGPNCSGGSVNSSDNSAFTFAEMNNWSCPDAYHSCPVTRSYSWPYIQDGTYSVAGANLNGEVYDRNQGVLGWICTHIYLFGQGTC